MDESLEKKKQKFDMSDWKLFTVKVTVCVCVCVCTCMCDRES